MDYFPENKYKSLNYNSMKYQLLIKIGRAHV